MCTRCPLFWKDHVFRYVQVMCEEQSNDAQVALAGLLKLKRRLIENPSLQLDKETKRLRQANFKQQHELRQERRRKQLTEVDREALMACGGDEVLGEMDMENTTALEHTGTDAAAKAAGTSWNHAMMPGMRLLPCNDFGYRVEGLFVAEQNAVETEPTDRAPANKIQVSNPLLHAVRPQAFRHIAQQIKVKEHVSHNPCHNLFLEGVARLKT
jgi:hypothetical protein